MKKIIMGTLLLLIATATFSQQTNPTPTLTKQDWLQKSKHQKTAAWIMLGSGICMVGGGLAINLSGGLLNGNGSKGLWLSYLGGATTIASIPLFIAASKNKNKATSLSFKNEATPQLNKNGFVYRAVPSLTLKISL
jgi:hypothetical protein